jgi:hypothetical protein
LQPYGGSHAAHPSRGQPWRLSPHLG